MVVFPNCKINLGLLVVDKRPDGYHNIETVFYPVSLRDAAEITISSGKNDLFEFKTTGINIPGENSGNLCHKAWQLIKNDFPNIPSLKMHLHKAIPIGAGLGGGSSDGAFTLLLLNEVFQLDISKERLLEYALELGSDCPFFILNKPCIATGRGEEMKEINLSLDNYYFVLVDSGIHVNTGWAFSQVEKNILPGKEEVELKSLNTIISRPVHEWKNELVNDFEKPVFKEYPSLKK